MVVIEIGQQVLRGFGFYSDEVECFHDASHKVLWWTNGLWCLNENKYVKGVIRGVEKGQTIVS